MSNKISRRTVVGGIAATTALSALRKPIVGKVEDSPPDLAVANGPDVVKNAKATIAAFNGMEAFVSAGDSVGVLINGVGRIPTAHTDLNVLRTLVEMCKEVGAKEVRVLSWLERDRMRTSRLWEKIPATGAIYHEVDQSNPDLWKEVEVPRGKVLSKIRMFKVLFEPDVLIWLPVCKNHSSAKMTCALKLAMATTIREDNRRYMHQERSRHLEQCVADLNTVVRAPDLVIMDAMEVLISGGPGGPGQTENQQKIIAGKDRVAIDAYCAPLLGQQASESIQIRAAADHGLGQPDLSKLNIKEMQIS